VLGESLSFFCDWVGFDSLAHRLKSGFVRLRPNPFGNRTTSKAVRYWEFFCSISLPCRKAEANVANDDGFALADSFGVTERIERNQSRDEERALTFKYFLSFASNLIEKN
jgi:hypothetical protein